MKDNSKWRGELCSWCRLSLSSIYSEPRSHVFGAAACSDDCEKALDLLLDGEPMDKVKKRFPRGE